MSIITRKKLTLTLLAVTAAATIVWAITIGLPYIVIGHPLGNGQMELTIYQDNKALKKRSIKLASESQLKEIAAGIITHEFLPRVGPNITGRAFVTRAGWVNGDYVMVVGYAGRLGGGYH